MTPKHVVILNDFAHVNGGAGQVALSSARGLAERGMEVTVFSAVGPAMANLSAKRIRLECTGQQEIARDNSRIRAAAQGLWNYKASSRLRTILKQLNPSTTVVHIHGWTKALSASVIRQAISDSFPTVLTMHDYFLACPNGGFFDYKRDRVCSLTAMSRECLATACDKHSYAEKIWRIGRQVITRGPGKLPDGIRDFISISDFSRQILTPYLPSEARVHAVPNPISVEKGDPSSPGSNQLFLFVGRLEPEKGPLLLAEAAQRAGVRVVFVGEGSLREKLLNHYPQTECVGWVPADQVQGYLRQARALVLPSRWYETQGLVVLEAAACGIPAVVPDRCAATELVKDGETGLVFSNGDCNDLASTLRSLLDKPVASRLGRAAYDHYWTEPATLDRHLDTLLKVYGSILENYAVPA